MRVLLGLSLFALLLPATAGARSNDYLWQCVAINREEARFRCYARLLHERVERSGDPARELPRIDREVRAMGGEVAGSCHALMHEVGRRYGRAHRLTLSTLRRYVPRSNDPTCSAGFGMGLVMYLGPRLRRSANVLAPCQRLATRFRRYTCIHGVGHALMRGHHGQLRPAVATCQRLLRYGQDCAQGVFHDYWISLRGADGTTRRTSGLRSPRYVCDGRYGYVRPCWYRYFVEQPLGPVIGSAKDIRRACTGLTTLQLQGCVMGASLAASPDPFEQMRICARLWRYAASCLHGVSVPALSGEPRRQAALIRRCELFNRDERLGCYSWLGRTLAVVTDGRFECVAPDRAARRACTAGSRRTDEALIAFA
jgi:hypothetical protein